ncbi:DUF4391 domain-containing protein [Nonlabens ponticola]|uniref:DUF4391 domain-containing protein n=1 Tax=Nonlabens ponticola TaxID=2496866 RepID=A0A3S9N0D9_9FLAO|nr:DUF4391 domain-containing protein [Nonlabens ponticola]AZQ44859.1 DUF4391 domain-containing protein [Nonlabens ponticola]
MSYRYNDIFQIPERSLVQQRLTKAYFLRQMGLTSAEKKLINNNIESMEVLAQLIPEKSNIPAVVNDIDSFEQVLVIICTVSTNELDKLAEKCIHFIQKYISHQVVLIIEDDFHFILNAADKRINQADNSKLTIERYFNTSKLSKLYKNEHGESFFEGLNFSNLDKKNLELLYKSYIQAIVQYQAASITGTYQKRSNARTAQDMEHLAQIEQLERDILSFAGQIKKESQLNEKVRLNMKIQEKRNQIKDLKHLLNEH